MATGDAIQQMESTSVHLVHLSLMHYSQPANLDNGDLYSRA